MEIVRPCFLVIDREYSGSISTRKLVIETAKFNVLTAYSAAEGLEMLRRFPAVDGVVMNAEMHDMHCDELIATLRQIRPTAPVVVVGRAPDSECSAADHTVETFEPGELLAVLQGLCPQQTEAVEKRNEELSEHE
ncbi:MAG TPA: response regulator [Acidobacteriaceae bacterium]|nr:response regulator [Acidobacteriaceae bacterium]